MYKKLNNCEHCGLIFENLNSSQRANHSRWCDKNPKRDEYVQKDKIEILLKQIDNLKILYTLEECKTFNPI